MSVTIGRRMAMAAAILLSTAVASAEGWELRPAAGDVPGSRQIEAGQIDAAIQVLAPELGSAAGSARREILQNLCVAYAMKKEYATAMRFCNQAVTQGAASAAALNNRGVVRAVTGDYRGAVQDLQRAGCVAECGVDCDSGSVRAVVGRNLGRVRERYEPDNEQPVLFRRGV